MPSDIGSDTGFPVTNTPYMPVNNCLNFLFISAFFEPTDMRIASKPFQLPKNLIRHIKFVSPNIYELNSISEYLGYGNFIENNEVDIETLFKNNPNFIELVKDASGKIAEYIDNVVVTLGSNGTLITRKSSSNDLRFFDLELRYIKPLEDYNIQHRFYTAKKLEKISNVSGAGDSFNSGMIYAMIGSYCEDICVSVGMESATAALNSTSAVPCRYFGKNHECWRNAATYKTL